MWEAQHGPALNSIAIRTGPRVHPAPGVRKNARELCNVHGSTRAYFPIQNGHKLGEHLRAAGVVHGELLQRRDKHVGCLAAFCAHTRSERRPAAPWPRRTHGAAAICERCLPHRRRWKASRCLALQRYKACMTCNVPTYCTACGEQHRPAELAYTVIARC
jgi:hypothetical protein